MTVDARGTLRDSTFMGGRLPQLSYDTKLANGALSVTADGRFEGFDPATLANRPELEGHGHRHDEGARCRSPTSRRRSRRRH